MMNILTCYTSSTIFPVMRNHTSIRGENDSNYANHADITTQICWCCFVVVVVVVDMVIVVLIFVAVKMFSIRDQLTLLDVIFDVVVVFVSNPTTVLRLCCVLLMLGLWQYDLILLGTQWIFVALKCSLLLYIPDYLSGNIKSLNVKYLVVM